PQQAAVEVAEDVCVRTRRSRAEQPVPLLARHLGKNVEIRGREIAATHEKRALYTRAHIPVPHPARRCREPRAHPARDPAVKSCCKSQVPKTARISAVPREQLVAALPGQYHLDLCCG